MPIPFKCPHCGLETLVSEEYAGRSGPCAGCSRTITVPGAASYGLPAEPSYDPAMRMILPVDRSLWAIAAGYMGLLAPCGPTAPLAIILAFIALRDLKRNPKLHGKGRAIFGLIMGAVFTALYGFFLIMAAVS